MTSSSSDPSSSDRDPSFVAPVTVDRGNEDEDDDDDVAESRRRPLLNRRRKEANKTGRGVGQPPLEEFEEDGPPTPSE